MNRPLTRLGAPAWFFIIALCACGPADRALPGPVGQDSQEIVAPTGTAQAYPEAALIFSWQASGARYVCSGALIAPTVVLTAGHCINGFTGWQVQLPYAAPGGVKAYVSKAEAYDGTIASSVSGSSYDVGLLILSAPVDIGTYPVLSTGPLVDGSQIIDIGRVDNGTVSYANLYMGPKVPVTSGSRVGWSHDYLVNYDIIQGGDSGGPAVVPGSWPHEIVAVTSVYNANIGSYGQELLARVDLV